MKHTPGPWSLIFINGKPLVSDICLIYSHEKFAEYADGNAHLIAAAPDLLDALQGMVAGYGHDFHTGSVALDKAIAAIAKAKGET